MKNRAHPDKKTYFFRITQRILLLILAISLIVSCVRLVWRAKTVQTLLESESQKVLELEAQKMQLEHSIQTATSSFELERRAREELLLQASDEAIWQQL